MPIPTFEGIVENGQIRLRDNVKLPESTKVYVIIAGLDSAPKAHVLTPRLAHPEQVGDFAKQVVEVSTDADV